MQTLLQSTAAGLYCPAGDFFVDPLRPVGRAVVTHAHADHARPGSTSYLAAAEGKCLLRQRLPGANIQFTSYGVPTDVNGVRVSFHPAGHICGSAQVRIEHRGQVAVVTGDYKLGEDATCAGWEPIDCHLLVTESTFALPVYRWPAQQVVFDAINQWWREAVEQGKCCVLYGYALGKSQRLLSGLDASIGPIYTHGAVEKGTEAYRQSGIDLPPTTYVGSLGRKHRWSGAMVVAVPSAHGTPWIRRFGAPRTAMASGWMAVRGTRRRRATDTGFVLSDHVDWPAFLEAIRHYDPEQVWVTHGYAEAACRYLREIGLDAWAVETRAASFEQEFEPGNTLEGDEPTAADSDGGESP